MASPPDLPIIDAGAIGLAFDMILFVLAIERVVMTETGEDKKTIKKVTVAAD